MSQLPYLIPPACLCVVACPFPFLRGWESRSRLSGGRRDSATIPMTVLTTCLGSPGPQSREPQQRSSGYLPIGSCTNQTTMSPVDIPLSLPEHKGPVPVSEWSKLEHVLAFLRWLVCQVEFQALSLPCSGFLCLSISIRFLIAKVNIIIKQSI